MVIMRILGGFTVLKLLITFINLKKREILCIVIIRLL